jgi:hypothetical protein
MDGHLVTARLSRNRGKAFRQSCFRTKRHREIISLVAAFGLSISDEPSAQGYPIREAHFKERTGRPEVGVENQSIR